MSVLVIVWIFVLQFSLDVEKSICDILTYLATLFPLGSGVPLRHIIVCDHMWYFHMKLSPLYLIYLSFESKFQTHISICQLLDLHLSTLLAHQIGQPHIFYGLYHLYRNCSSDTM